MATPVATMVRWWPWPPLSHKFEVRLVGRRIEGLPPLPPPEEVGAVPTAVAEVRWKGPKMTLSSLRPTVRRNRTWEEGWGWVMSWSGKRSSRASAASPLTVRAPSKFHPWEMAFVVFFNDLNCFCLGQNHILLLLLGWSRDNKGGKPSVLMA